MRPLSLYIHVPFCRRHCSYCTFYHVPHSEERESGFIETLVREIERAATDAGSAVYFPTVFFGGGTPSVLGPKSLDAVFETITPYLAPDGSTELTFETNPEDVTRELLVDLRARGVNRLSLGIQSMQPGAQTTLKRCSPTVNERAVILTKEHFDNINFDLLLGIPDGSQAHPSATVDRILAHEPAHLSVYCLEPGGVLEENVRAFFERVDPEQSARDYLYVCERLGQAGYHHYEVSNFAMPGYECVHNRAYWCGAEYLGVGPGAHSYLEGARSYNEPSIEAYIAAGETVPNGCRRFEPLGEGDRYTEALMLGLRTSEGLPVEKVRCGEQVLKALVENGLATVSEGRIVLTDPGFILLDEIVLRLGQAA
jgi:oxygen-independent coproporphyrinogen-3 oxidase